MEHWVLLGIIVGTVAAASFYPERFRFGNGIISGLIMLLFGLLAAFVTDLTKTQPYAWAIFWGGAIGMLLSLTFRGPVQERGVHIRSESKQ